MLWGVAKHLPVFRSTGAYNCAVRSSHRSPANLVNPRGIQHAPRRIDAVSNARLSDNGGRDSKTTHCLSPAIHRRPTPEQRDHAGNNASHKRCDVAAHTQSKHAHILIESNPRAFVIIDQPAFLPTHWTNQIAVLSETPDPMPYELEQQDQSAPGQCAPHLPCATNSCRNSCRSARIRMSSCIPARKAPAPPARQIELLFAQLTRLAADPENTLVCLVVKTSLNQVSGSRRAKLSVLSA